MIYRFYLREHNSSNCLYIVLVSHIRKWSHDSYTCKGHNPAGRTSALDLIVYDYTKSNMWKGPS